MISREAWGATPPTRGYTWVGRSSHVIVHHTAGPPLPMEEGKPGPKWYQLYRSGRANAAIRRTIRAYEKDKANVEELERRTMRQIQASHKARGYIDIGYHCVCFPSGRTYEGRPMGAQGAHAYNGNSHPGFSFAGDFTKQQPTARALAAFEAWKDDHGITSQQGHSNVPGNSTACPGDNLRRPLKLAP